MTGEEEHVGGFDLFYKGGILAPERPTTYTSYLGADVPMPYFSNKKNLQKAKAAEAQRAAADSGGDDSSNSKQRSRLNRVGSGSRPASGADNEAPSTRRGSMRRSSLSGARGNNAGASPAGGGASAVRAVKRGAGRRMSQHSKRESDE